VDVIEQKLSLTPSQTHFARKILAENGNMSSPTILFVLKEIMEKESSCLEFYDIIRQTLLNPFNGEKNYAYEEFDVIKEYASQKRSLDVAEQVFSYKANEWYRENIYNLEEDSKKKDNPLDYFNKYGSKAFKTLAPSAKVFDKEALIHNCSAIKRVHEQAEESHYLEHEARLFLCSILTYTEDSIKYLHEILSCCHDYNFEKSSAHINDWIKRRQMGIGGRPYTCDRANSVGVGCGECNLEKIFI
jgi:hypothetical protein